MQLHQIFRRPALEHVALEALRRKAEAALSQAIGPTSVTRLDTEFSFYIRYQEGHAADTLTPKRETYIMADTVQLDRYPTRLRCMVMLAPKCCFVAPCRE